MVGRAGCRHRLCPRDPGVRLAYERAGRGTPIIFLHGGLLDRRMWDDQFAFFAQQYQAIGSQLATIPEAGHTLVLEKPAEFNTLLDQFLRGHAPRRMDTMISR